ncbi:MAG: thiamine diphosphokinase [Actinomycetota bacterium]|nr:thiamine diphosphokinase [Actinomycetota bacterium]
MADDLKRPVVILCGGPAPHAKAIEHLPVSAKMIAVDSGLDHGRKFNLEPDLIIGDLDSISSEGLRWAKEQSIEIQKFPKDKDKSDLEIALDQAKGLSKSVFVLAADTGRFDHTFGVISALGFAAPFFESCHAIIGNSYCTFITESGEIYRSNGATVSVFAIGGVAVGVTMQGFKWELEHALLPSGSTRGLSNEVIVDVGIIAVDDGVLAVIQPESI